MRAHIWIVGGLVFLLAVLFFSQSPSITGRFVDEPTERVIVILNPDAQSNSVTGASAEESVNELQQETAEAQQKVLEDVNSPGAIGRLIGAKPLPDVEPERTIETLPVMVVQATAEGIEKLKSHPLVEVVLPDIQFSLSLAQSVPLINADDVQNITVNGQALKGSGIAVCVMDTGIQADHPAFEGRVVAQKCYCSSGCCPNNSTEDSVAPDANPLSHGTHVSGIIGSNGTYKGVAPAVNIVAVRVCGTSCSLSDIVSGMDFCVTNKDVYNIKVMSGSFGDGGNYHLQSDCPTYLDSGVDAAYNAGVAGVFASGNNGFTSGVSYPGCSPHAISVGATDKNDILASFTNRGPLLKVLAPGVSITSTKAGNAYQALSGTSQATPHVSGVIALLQQYALLTNQTFSVDQIKQALILTGVNISGYPRIDALAALQYLGYNSSNTPNATNTTPLNITILSPLPDAVEFSNGTNLVANVSLSNASVVWSSNISGELGIGSNITVNLTPGAHLLFANAASGNQTASANVSITVLEAISNGEPLNITITSPANGSTFDSSSSILLSAVVSGNESNVNVTWSSNNSGTIAFGESANVTLNTGSHLITASAVEGNESADASVIVNVVSPPAIPEPPVNMSISILQPAANATLLTNGTKLLASIIPANSSVTWSSNVSGILGFGINITVNLSAGKHKIMALATYGSSSANANANVSVVSATCVMDIDLNNNNDADVGDMILLLTAYNDNLILCSYPTAGECVIDLDRNNDHVFNTGDIIVLLGEILKGTLKDLFGSSC